MRDLAVSRLPHRCRRDRHGLERRRVREYGHASVYGQLVPLGLPCPLVTVGSFVSMAALRAPYGTPRVRSMDVARIAERYFQRLLHETDPLRAVGELAGMWEPRSAASGMLPGVSPPEQHVTMVLIYVGEVGNGGHTQFFSNRGGDIVARVRAALREIGLFELEAVIENAVAIVPASEVPADRAAVDRLLGTFTEDQLARLDRLDKETWRLDPYPRLLAYMREHKDELLRPERGFALSEDTT